METIRYSEKRRSTKWPAIIVLVFLILGGAFVAYGIKYEDNPEMLGLSVEATTTESNSLESSELTEAQKLEQAMNINYEIKDISSSDSTSSSFVSNINVPAIYVEGKELTDINASIVDEYTQRFDSLKSQMSDANSNYQFNVSYTYCDNIVGVRKIVSILVTQQIIDTDSQKVTSEKLTTYNIDLSAKTILSQSDVLYDILGKDYKDILKDEVKNYVISNGYITEYSYSYEITYLENFYIKDGILHIVFNTDSDNIVSTDVGIMDIEINT